MLLGSKRWKTSCPVRQCQYNMSMSCILVIIYIAGGSYILVVVLVMIYIAGGSYILVVVLVMIYIAGGSYSHTSSGTGDDIHCWWFI